MLHRPSHRTLALVAALLLIGGCSRSAQRVDFVNASDTWINVRVFVADPGHEVNLPMAQAAQPAPGHNAFVSEARHQVRPGESLVYDLSWNPNFHRQPAPLVHVMVEPVTPSWMPAAKKYWLELLTPPPVTIVTTGEGEELRFNSGGGAVAMIPEDEIMSERFDHQVVTVPEADQ
jgi:hypothetical protein